MNDKPTAEEVSNVLRFLFKVNVISYTEFNAIWQRALPYTK